MPQELDRCVKALKRQKGVDNPFAVCRAQLGSDAEIKARRRKRRKRK